MALIISASEVSVALSASYSEEEVELAQGIVELAAGTDLATEDPEDRFEEFDLRRLRLAVQWQAAYLRSHPEVLVAIPARRASTNGASIEYAAGVEIAYAPLALRFVNACSWRRPASAISVATLRPTLPYEAELPDPWIRL